MDHHRVTLQLSAARRRHGCRFPPVLPEFAWPWQQANASGDPIGLSWSMVRELLPAAFAIAMLGAIESLLCAVVLDGMTGKRHRANSELMGQGLGNIIAPFFRRHYRNRRYCPFCCQLSRCRIARLGDDSDPAVVFWRWSVVCSSPPMPAMAALLIMVAWNMKRGAQSRALAEDSAAQRCTGFPHLLFADGGAGYGDCHYDRCFTGRGIVYA